MEKIIWKKFNFELNNKDYKKLKVTIKKLPDLSSSFSF